MSFRRFFNPENPRIADLQGIQPHPAQHALLSLAPPGANRGDVGGGHG